MPNILQATGSSAFGGGSAFGQPTQQPQQQTQPTGGGLFGSTQPQAPASTGFGAAFGKAEIHSRASTHSHSLPLFRWFGCQQIDLRWPDKQSAHNRVWIFRQYPTSNSATAPSANVVVWRRWFIRWHVTTAIAEYSTAGTYFMYA